MGFSNQERINLNSKVLAASVKDANEVGQWYESFFPNKFVLTANKVWSDPDLATLLASPAPNLAAAQSAASASPTVIQDLSDVTSAVRLTEVPGSNGSTYVAFSTYNDLSSPRLEDWIQPQQVARTDGIFQGYPSIGYAVRLFDGDPNSGGTEILTSDGQTGSGSSASVGWVFDYANGMLLLSNDFRGTIADPYILGFRYIGSTLAGSIAFSLEQETVSVFNGQTSFLLSLVPLDENAVMMFINGQKQQYGIDYSLVSTSVTYSGSYSLESTDIVEFWYIGFSPNSITQVQTSVTVTSDGQTSLTLPSLPYDSTFTQMYINGSKQVYGLDYTVIGTTVTYLDTDLETTDKVEFWYITSLGSLSGDINQEQETLNVASDGQVLFTISNLPFDPTTIQMFINGQKQQYGVDYISSGVTISYFGTPDLETTDTIEVWYITDNSSNIAESLSATLAVGNTTDGYDIILTGGSVIRSTDGDVTVDDDLYITGKLTVDGLIDPTGLVLTEQSSAPYSPTSSEGMLWVRNDGYFMFTDQGGVDHTVDLDGTGGGGGGGSSDLTEPDLDQDGYVAIAAGGDLTYLRGASDGDVLTWNEVSETWESATPAGGTGDNLDGYLALSGGTMTGDIDLNTNLLTDVGGLTMSGSINLTNNDITNVNNIQFNGDSSYISGIETITFGGTSGGINLNNFDISNVGTIDGYTILDFITSGSGDVIGPGGGATDNAIARYDGTSGNLIKDSVVEISDAGDITGATLDGYTAVELFEGSGNSGNLSPIITEYRFSNNTTAADPGAGRFRLNNADPALATEIYLSSENNNGADLSNIIGLISSGLGLYIQESSDATIFIVATTTSAPVDNTGWFTLQISVSDNNGSFVNNRDCGLAFFNGGSGGSGDLTAPTSDQDGYVALASGEDLTYLRGTSDGDVLTWNETSEAWESSTPTGGGGLGPTKLTVLAGLQSTDTTGFSVVSAFEFDAADYDGYSTITFNALIETSNAADDVEIRLYNLTGAYVLTSSILSSSSTETVSVTADITSDINPSNGIYEVQLRLTTTGSPNLAICKRAELLIE